MSYNPTQFSKHMGPLFSLHFRKRYLKFSNICFLSPQFLVSQNVSKMLICIFGFWYVLCHNIFKYCSNYKIKEIFKIYIEWAIEKCPIIPSGTLWKPRNYRSKSVNSFAGHPVYFQD